MKAAIAAIALSTIAVAAPLGAAQAQTFVTIGIDTPGFGIRFGTPLVPVAPVVPIYAPVPVYAPPVVYAPPRVVYVSPPVVVQPRAVHPVVYPYGPAVAKRHKHRHRDGHRVIVPAGYVRGRY